MDPWVLRTVVATGSLEVYIGLNPDTVDKGGHIWSSSTAGGRDVRISVKTTDADFHLATYYYVYYKSTSSQDANIRIELI
jgi:stress response protein SCP2